MSIFSNVMGNFFRMKTSLTNIFVPEKDTGGKVGSLLGGGESEY